MQLPSAARRKIPTTAYKLVRGGHPQTEPWVRGQTVVGCHQHLKTSHDWPRNLPEGRCRL